MTFARTGALAKPLVVALALLTGGALRAQEGPSSGAPPRAPQVMPLSERIGQTDRAKMEHVARRHDGAQAGIDVMTLIPADRMKSNFIYMFRGEIPPKGGIGHHYHMHVEEMFIIFDNELEFTVDGRTANLKGPIGAPVRYDHSHGLYNPSDRTTQWMNFGVSEKKGVGEVTRNLGDPADDRIGVTVDPRPTFVTMRLNRAELKPQQAMLGGKGTAQYRRALSSEDFKSNWAYVDHIVLPAGASIGRHRHAGVEEIFYVMDGQGTAEVGKESAAIRKGAAVPIFLNETHSIVNSGTADLELMVMGITMEKGKLDTTPVP